MWRVAFVLAMHLAGCSLAGTGPAMVARPTDAGAAPDSPVAPADVPTAVDLPPGLDAPTTDVGSLDVALPDAPLPSDPVGERFVRNLAVLRAGGSVDLDGDGRVDMTSTVRPDGSSTRVWQGATRELVRTEYAADGSVHTVADRDQDGRPDYDRQVGAPGSGAPSVETEDLDRDGVMDHRVTITHASTARMSDQTISVEVRGHGATPSWQLESRYTGPGYDAQCAVTPRISGPSVGASCAAETNAIPGYDALRAAAVDIEPGVFVIRSGPYHCDVEQHVKLRDTFARVHDDLPRLMTINKTLYDALLGAFTHNTLLLGCDLPLCLVRGNVRALTAGDPASMFPEHPGGWFMTFHPDDVALPVDEFEELVAHELMHFANAHHTGSEDGEGQRDMIYSCARHINRCRAFAPTAGHHFYLGSPTTDASSARDVAFCAEREHKGEFHTTLGAPRPHVTALQMRDNCSVETRGLTLPSFYCGPNPMDPPTAAGLCCRRSEPVWCDLTTIPESAWVLADSAGPRCIEACPAGLVNDFPCEGVAGLPVVPKFTHVCGYNIESCEY